MLCPCNEQAPTEKTFNLDMINWNLSGKSKQKEQWPQDSLWDYVIDGIAWLCLNNP